MSTKTVSTLPLEYRLLSAATQYDIKLQEKQPNPYRLALIMQGLERFHAQVASGDSVARSLYDNFNDRLLSTLERAAGVPLTYRGGSKDRGRPA
jgi:hypothetical protein